MPFFPINTDNVCLSSTIQKLYRIPCSMNTFNTFYNTIRLCLYQAMPELGIWIGYLLDAMRANKFNGTVETLYNEVLGTKILLLYQGSIINNTKQNESISYLNLRKKLVISGISLHQISLYWVANGQWKIVVVT